MSGTNEQTQSILIVEDSSSYQSELLDLLAKYESEFPSVDVVSSEREALEYVKENPPLICLISYRLENESGLSVLRKIRCQFSSEILPIVMLTDQEDEELAVALLQSGAQSYLLKQEVTAARLYGAIWSAVRASSMQKQLNHYAHYDALTGLLNRNLLMNRLAQALQRCDRYHQRCALMRLNLDGFKPINETYGHGVGDALLQAVGERIKRNCRTTDSAARSGGDEFIVLIEHVDNNTGRKVAEKLLQALATPFEIEGHTLFINASIGLATYPDTAESPDELLQQADQALMRAKQQVSVSFVSFSEQHKHQWARQTTLEQALPKAIARGELALVFQPIVKADDFTLKRLEVLSRWPREDYAVNALELIEMIDRLNLLEPFHEWLFATAFGQMKAWQGEGINPDLCLNIPANYCYSPLISNGIKAALTANNVDPRRVELEITESTLMRSPEKSIQVLQGLYDYGMGIAVDDFGTGYSSMSYLSRLPLDTIKIDRHFFLTEVQLERNRKIIDAITALGHSLELQIIAEGIETELQLKTANEVGCDLLQGYYFGRPESPGASWAEYFGKFNHIIL